MSKIQPSRSSTNLPSFDTAKLLIFFHFAKFNCNQIVNSLLTKSAYNNRLRIYPYIINKYAKTQNTPPLVSFLHNLTFQTKT